MKKYIEKSVERQDLSVQEAAGALELIMTGQATDAQIAALLIALRAKGETVDELVGFATTMRRHAVKVAIDDPDAIDMCGTGGDGIGTFNISTVASLVVAGAGVTVAKHGNRSVSSRSGSADLLSALGVSLQLAPEDVRECINTVGIGFLYAPTFHPAMKAAAKSRAELGVRTIFNMLGPITNPASVQHQLIGVYERSIAPKLAAALRRLDSGRTCVVHSEDGMDEVTVSGTTHVYEVTRTNGTREYAVRPADFGLTQHARGSVQGGSAEENAAIARAVLDGEKGPARDIVAANAAFGLYIAGKAGTLTDAAMLAAESIDSGRALQKLSHLVEFTGRS